MVVGTGGPIDVVGAGDGGVVVGRVGSGGSVVVVVDVDGGTVGAVAGTVGCSVIGGGSCWAAIPFAEADETTAWNRAPATSTDPAMSRAVNAGVRGKGRRVTRPILGGIPGTEPRP